MNKTFRTCCNFLIGFCALLGAEALFAEPISEIVVHGNSKIEANAIISIISSKKGSDFQKAQIQEDIRNLYELGYFSHISIYRQRGRKGLRLIIEVREKPSIVAIEFSGQDKIDEEKLREGLQTQLYAVVDEDKIAEDVRMIEQKYAQKGFYLAQITYSLQKVGENEVVLQFKVVEHHKVEVASVSILGNKHFSDEQLISKMLLQPATRAPKFKALTNFQEEVLKHDTGQLSLLYKNAGFIKVKIAETVLQLSSDRRAMHITYKIEEGSQYRVGSLAVSGDLLLSSEKLLQAMSLKAGELFRFNRFRSDIEGLMNRYGDFGFAYTDVEPVTKIDEKKHEVHLDYRINKGDKIYFGKIEITGNHKTRDNVIRRELEIRDGDLYSGTKMRRSRENVQRLGFFNSVQISKERDKKHKDLLHVRVEVEERSTGQIHAAAIFTPAGGSVQSGWAGQGRYDEKNQLGKGWSTNITGKWSGKKNFSLNLGFTNPRVNDSYWMLGASFFHMQENRRYIENEFLDEIRQGSTVSVGRKIIEHLTGTLTYKLQNTALNTDAYVLRKFREAGLSSSITLSLSRNATNDYLEPSSGSQVSVFQVIAGGLLLRGDKKYLESGFDFSYYYPLDFSENYRTHFRIYGAFSYIYPFGAEPVPFMQRYRLGGFQDLRGFPFWQLGPKFYVLRSPTNTPAALNFGGDRKAFMQVEYFVPLIQEARVKALLFADVGRVYHEEETLGFSGYSADIGFGFRWITPIAPLRFEWAYPVKDGRLGSPEFIFYLGF